MDELTSIRDILLQKQTHRGWLHLPPAPWTLDTQGVFVEQDLDAEPDSTDHIPTIVKVNHWPAVLDADGIEDIVDNAAAQLGEATPDELFKAFVFYVENDAFLEF